MNQRPRTRLWPPEGADRTLWRLFLVLLRWRQRCGLRFTSVVRMDLFLHKAWTQKPHGGLNITLVSNVCSTSGALQFNVHTCALKKLSHGFSADHRQACCIMLTAIKKNVRHWIIFVIDSCLSTLILHWLKTWPDPFIARMGDQILRMRAADWGRGPNLNPSDREKACGLRSWLKLSNCCLALVSAPPSCYFSTDLTF